MFRNQRMMELTASGLIAIIGLIAVTLPALRPAGNDLTNAFTLFAPIIGGIGGVYFLIRAFARGIYSGAALLLIGAPVYFALVLGAIALSMTGIVSA